MDGNRTPRDFVFKGLDLMSDPLSTYVELRLRTSWGVNWLSEARQRYDGLLANDGRLNRDVLMLLKTVDRCWDPAFRGALGRTDRAHVNELIDIRNRISHQESFTDDEAERALSTMSLLMNTIGENDCADKLKQMRADILFPRVQHTTEQSVRRPEPPLQTVPAWPGRRRWNPENVSLILDEVKQQTFYTKSAGIRHFICKGFMDREIADAYSAYTVKTMPPQFPNQVRRKMNIKRDCPEQS